MRPSFVAEQSGHVSIEFSPSFREFPSPGVGTIRLKVHERPTASKARPRPPVNLDLAMTAIGIESRGHQAAAVLPEVKGRAVGSADRKAVRSRAHHLQQLRFSTGYAQTLRAPSEI
jgi:hypothetical protein